MMSVIHTLGGEIVARLETCQALVGIVRREFGSVKEGRGKGNAVAFEHHG